MFCKKMKKKHDGEKCCGPMGKSGDMVYCLGVIGSLVFYLQNAGSFIEGVAGILKAFVWPAMLIYRLMGMG